MSVLLYRYLTLFAAVSAACILAACATTNTGSEAGISAESEVSAQVEPDVAEITEPIEVEAEALQTEAQPQFDPVPAALEADAAPDSVTTGSAQTDVVEGVAVFPEQPYEIEEPLEFETDSDTEIDRLREELAASESELARSRAREAERDFASEQASSSSADGGDMEAATDEPDSGPPAHTTTAQASQVPEPGATGRASEPVGKPVEYSIYFGYNQTALELEFETTVVKHAEFLKANPDLMVEIQGNCDERGSREYNIALGERRAYTIKRALELLGINGGRIRTVSFGAEKPIAFGHDEESWRLNRRADIVY